MLMIYIRGLLGKGPANAKKNGRIVHHGGGVAQAPPDLIMISLGGEGGGAEPTPKMIMIYQGGEGVRDPF